MSAGLGLGDGDLAVTHEGGVVVDLTAIVQDPAVPVVGVLVEAEIGYEDHLVTEVVAQLSERDLDDAVTVRCARSDRVLAGWHPEQHERSDPERREPLCLEHQRSDGVL